MQGLVVGAAVRRWNWFLRHVWRRADAEQELEEEIRSHLALEARLRMDRGEPPETAWSGARKDFGNVDLVKEVTRDMWGWRSLERIGQDLRFGWRTLLKNPGFTAFAVGTLALGIAATTAMFTMVNSILLKPLPFPQADRLAMAWELPPEDPAPNPSVQSQNFLDWRAKNRSFVDIGAFVQTPVTLSGQGEPEQLSSLLVTAGFFPVLGVAPLLGRVFTPEEDRPGVPRDVVMSYELWRRRFGSDRHVVGRKILLNGTAREVIGVMPRGFAFPNIKADLYVPLQLDKARTPEEGRYLKTVARLRPGVSIQAAQADMKGLAVMTERERPEINSKWGATALPIMDFAVGQVRRTLWVLLAAVGFLLLIACVNVANLLFLRAAGRRREINVRLALGAGRWRIVHQLIVESVLLSVLGGLAGLALAQWGLTATLGLLPADFPLPRLEEIRLDPIVFAFAAAVSLATGLLFGLVPAWQSSGDDVAEQLREGSRSVAGGGRRLRRLLVVSEIAVALLLVIGAGLMVRSFLQLNAVDPGFRAEHVLTWKMLLPRIEEENSRAIYMDQVLNELRSLPGVVSVSSILWLPLSGEKSESWFYRADVPEPPPSERSGGGISVVSKDYFATMGIPRLAGRDFDDRDRPGSLQAAILSQSAVRLLYPRENPIGKRLKVFWDGEPEAEIIGVVADSRNDSLNLAPVPTLYLPNSQRPKSNLAVVLRAAGDPKAMIPAVRSALRRVNPNQAIARVQTMEDLMAGAVARSRFQAYVLGGFAVVALLLACIGIYGLISYSVTQRSHEIGIRLALGAAPRAVRNLLFREGLILAGLGVVAGLLASVLLSRFLETLLFEVKVTDPIVYGTVVALLVGAASLACYIPARRAARVDPQVALRNA